MTGSGVVIPEYRQSEYLIKHPNQIRHHYVVMWKMNGI